LKIQDLKDELISITEKQKETESKCIVFESRLTEESKKYTLILEENSTKLDKIQKENSTLTYDLQQLTVEKQMVELKVKELEEINSEIEKKNESKSKK